MRSISNSRDELENLEIIDKGADQKTFTLIKLIHTGVECLLEAISNQEQAIMERDSNIKILQAKLNSEIQMREKFELEIEQLKISSIEAVTNHQRKSGDSDMQDKLAQLTNMLQEQSEMVERYKSMLEEEKANFAQHAEALCNNISQLESENETAKSENEELKEEMKSILQTVDQKVKEVTDLNMKYEKKIKQYKSENRDLREKIERIEEELEQLTLRGNKMGDSFGKLKEWIGTANPSSLREAGSEVRKDEKRKELERKLYEKEVEVEKLKNKKKEMEADIEVEKKKSRILRGGGSKRSNVVKKDLLLDDRSVSRSSSKRSAYADDDKENDISRSNRCDVQNLKKLKDIIDDKHEYLHKKMKKI